jgi:hypothetical protein
VVPISRAFCLVTVTFTDTWGAMIVGVELITSYVSGQHCQDNFTSSCLVILVGLVPSSLLRRVRRFPHPRTLLTPFAGLAAPGRSGNKWKSQWKLVLLSWVA